MEQRTNTHGGLNTLAYARIADPRRPISVYFEGDGRAWITRRTLSRDPTPLVPVAALLALEDPGPNTIWIARPCQYPDAFPSPGRCAPKHWSSDRYSEEIIDAVDQALSVIVDGRDKSGLRFVGYSGGAAIAALVADRRRGAVESLTFVAGNLDHVALSRHHDVSILTGSKNPIDIAVNLATVPQYHFTGADDDIIPPTQFDRWRAASQASGAVTCMKQHVLENVSHSDGWIARWRDLLKRASSCEEPA